MDITDRECLTGKTFIRVLDRDAEALRSWHERLTDRETNLMIERAEWLARIAFGPYQRVLEDVAGFRRLCMDTGIARHGRTEIMLLRYLVGGESWRRDWGRIWANAMMYGYQDACDEAEMVDKIIEAGGIVAASELQLKRQRQNDEGYYLTPPEIYAEKDREHHFDTDCCPHPRQPGYDGLTAPLGQSVYGNPMFVASERGKGPTAWVKRTIEHHRRTGANILMVLPVQGYVNMLVEAGAVLTPAGRIPWRHTVTREPHPSPPNCMWFHLPGTETSPLGSYGANTSQPAS